MRVFVVAGVAYAVVFFAVIMLTVTRQSTVPHSVVHMGTK